MAKKDFDIDYILDVNYRDDPLRFILDTSFWTIIVTVIIFFTKNYKFICRIFSKKK
jgi:hypothetical protein